MKILAIETSCDETALALVEANGGLRLPHFKVLKNFVSSQIAVHRPWGGVVPNLAKREHLKNLPIIFQIIMKPELKNKKTLRIHQPLFLIPKVEALAVTVGPGLEPALWTGINFVKDLKANYFSSAGQKIPLVGVNHLEGHLYSFLLPGAVNEKVYKKFGLKAIFPAIALIISGGHTVLLYLESLAKWKKLGETRDDAAGEAFDKVARMLGLSYPGGPEVEKAAKKGNPKAILFPRPMFYAKNYDFSFSGLKTAVLYFIRDAKQQMHSNAAKYLSRHSHPFVVSNRDADIAASFQSAVIDVLVAKTIRAVREFHAKSILLSGGVAANKKIRTAFRSESRKIGVYFFAPSIVFNTDNAVMIAAAAYINYLRKKNRSLRAQSNLSL